MAGRDIVTIGASAGGVEALMRLVAALPADLPAALFVVLHIPAAGPSFLPEILSRAGKLPAVHARDGEPIVRGHISVAPPDFHLLLTASAVRVTRGPRENRQRPAVDPLFRTAAAAFGPRVIGVILSGSLDDGTAGLVAIKNRGGLALVQDPADALIDSMPRGAMEAVTPDRVLSAEDLGVEIGRLVRQPIATAEPAMAEGSPRAPGSAEPEPGGVPASLACPTCGGTLWELHDDALVQFRCRVGHQFSPASLLAEQRDTLEDALWAALRSLEEQASLADRLTRRARDKGHAHSAARFAEQQRDAEARAGVIRRVLLADIGDPVIGLAHMHSVAPASDVDYEAGTLG